MYKTKAVIVLLSIGILLPVQASEYIDQTLRIVNNPATETHELKQYVNDSDWRVRKALATRQTTPADLLILLAKDSDARVRIALTHNLRAPQEALIILLNDTSEDVRFGLAHCGYTPPEILVQLANDPVRRIRKQLIVNPNLPLKVLSNIAEGQSDLADTANEMLKQRKLEDR